VKLDQNIELIKFDSEYSDVEACYALFLGRLPENNSVILSHAGQDIINLIRNFISSPEYLSRLSRLNDPTGVDSCWPALIEWAGKLALTSASKSHLAIANSRALVARILLTDANLARALMVNTMSHSELDDSQDDVHASFLVSSPKMRLINQINSTGEAGVYNATGPDPFIFIEQWVPQGYLRISFDIKFLSVSDPYGHSRLIQIFLCGKDGMSESQSWTFDGNALSSKFDEIIYSPSEANFIRLDPSNQPGYVYFNDFRAYSLEFEEAQRRLFSKWLTLVEADYKAWRTAPLISDFFHESQSQQLTQMLANPQRIVGDRYDAWVSRRHIDSLLHKKLSQQGRELKFNPKFSILLPTYNSDLKYLAIAVQSVLNQTYEIWELCIVDDGSTQPEVAGYLESLERKDSRISVILSERNGGISKATNIALSRASGDFIALLDHDDELAPHALFAMASAINDNPDADFLYSDEDKITHDGHRFGPFFKPDWSPHFMLGCMYTCHLGVYRTELVRAVGGFRSEFDLAQDYDLALRVSSRARLVVHVADILYHWRILPTSTASGADAKPTAELAARRAVQSYRDALGLKGKVVPGPIRGTHRVQPDVDRSRKISIVIPSAARRIKDHIPSWYLLDLLNSIFFKSTHRCFEVILVHNGDIEPKLEKALEPFDLIYVHYDKEVFNIAEKMNLGVAHATSDLVLLLNDDMTVITPDWLEQMLMWIDEPDVVGVGAKLFFPSNNIQHAGVLLLGQGPSHVYYDMPSDIAGLAGSALLVRNYSALTGACLMVRKIDYERVGGFDISFRLNYNDVDFCLRLGKLGRLVYTPFANLYHYESVSREPAPPEELIQFNSRWRGFVGHDPMYNRNLSQNSGSHEVTQYPRPILMDYPSKC
jgi:glycosyltransferase involved in cell wall biosynthesis